MHQKERGAASGQDRARWKDPGVCYGIALALFGLALVLVLRYPTVAWMVWILLPLVIVSSAAGLVYSVSSPRRR